MTRRSPITSCRGTARRCTFFSRTAIGARNACPRNKAIKSREGEGVRKTKGGVRVCVCRAQLFFFFLPSGSDQAGALVCAARLRREPCSASRFFFAPRELRMGLEALRDLFLFLLDARRAAQQEDGCGVLLRGPVFEFRRLRGSERSACSREALCAPSPWRGPRRKGPQATPVCGMALSRVVRWSSVRPPPSSSPPSSCASSCVVVTLLLLSSSERRCHASCC